MSSNWFANRLANPPPRQRERFASPLAICGLIGAGMLLLTMLYPEKNLLILLSAPEVTTPAQQKYLEILVKIRIGDVDLVLILARSYLAAMLPEKAQQALEQLQGDLSSQQLQTVLALRYEVRRQQLQRLRPGDSRWSAAQQAYARQVEHLVQSGASSAELGRYCAEAKSAGDTETFHHLETLLQKNAEQGIDVANRQNPEGMTAESALARGDYRGAAAIQFHTMGKVPGNEKRKYFIGGVRALQSGNLLNDALTEAEKYLAPLANDRETLLFLSRLALSSNRPDLAQRYIRRALGMADSGNGGA
ncbi:MAG: hypothetical protein PHF56_16760 [Desulfuromonadaceae bacterium]|nr:hypothetical protein [Desulfuromonadaceae bacterium]